MVRSRTAAYWEGWSAAGTRTPCRFTDPQQQRDWSRGFAAAVSHEAESKRWYRSRTVWAGIVVLVVGLVALAFGYLSGVGNGGGPYMAAGGGLTASSLLFTALRLITDKPVGWAAL